jgi:hypothetical protein
MKPNFMVFPKYIGIIYGIESATRKGNRVTLQYTTGEVESATFPDAAQAFERCDLDSGEFINKVQRKARGLGKGIKGGGPYARFYK